MPVTSVKSRKDGRELLDIEFEGESMPAMPQVCPCCLDPAEPDTFLKIRSGPVMFRFPACRICVRHVPFFDTLTSLIAYISLGLGILTTLVMLIIMFGPVIGPTWPFRSAITGLMTIMAIGFFTVVFCLSSGLLIIPLRLLLAKRGCEEEPVKMTRLPKGQTPYSVRLTFENLKYGKMFSEANGAPKGNAAR